MPEYKLNTWKLNGEADRSIKNLGEQVLRNLLLLVEPFGLEFPGEAFMLWLISTSYYVSSSSD